MVTPLRNVDDPAGTRQKRRQCAVRGLDCVDGRNVPARGRNIPAQLVLHPQDAAGALDEIGQRDDRALLQALRRAFRRKRMGEAQPLLTVIVAVGKEVLADEDLEPGAKAPRRPDQHDQKRRREQELDLDGVTPVAAEVANEVACAGDQQQERAGHQQRGRMKDRTPGQVEIDRPAGIACSGHRNQRDHDGIGKPAGHPDGRVELSEQRRIRIQVEVEPEHAGERDGKRPYAPAHLRKHAPQHVLDQDEPEHRHAETEQVADARSRLPLRRQK